MPQIKTGRGVATVSSLHLSGQICCQSFYNASGSGQSDPLRPPEMMARPQMSKFRR
jgi:hypothetical protein